ncbi:MAG TPA: type III PLP-dependent enzyme [Verrucomicrobiae bacterium]|nr:type III PLP-dependent enzyme [Verrucomicrobiae bacterium]
MSHLPEFLTSRWDRKGNELLVGELRISSIVERHGTPLFIYDRNILEQKYAALRKVLPERFSVCYSVKANPHPAFLKFFLDKGCGLEVASGGEFYQARSAGCPPDKILFAGPGKTQAELALVIADGIGEIHAESELEIERISQLSRRLGHRTRVAIRVNPAEESRGGAMQMGGRSAPFGVDEEKLEPLLQRIAQDPYLRFQGIHLFVGTQILDQGVLLAQYRSGVEIARRTARISHTQIHTLDFGGGWGIPYFRGDSELGLESLRRGLLELMSATEGEPCFAGTTFIVEPGRFLAGEAGVYVTTVNDIKTSRGKNYLILDGGMNHHLAASGNLGQVVRRNFPIAILNRLDDPATQLCDLVGPLCTPLDTLGRGVTLPSARVGDLVGVFQSGAYARTASPLGFLSHPAPAEVWVQDGQDFLIRRRGASQDALRDVIPLGSVVESIS